MEWLKYPPLPPLRSAKQNSVSLDMVPAYWTEQEELLDRTKWKNTEVVKHSNIV